MSSAPRRRTNDLYPQRAVQGSPSPRAQVLLVRMRITMAIGLLGVLPVAYLMILRTDGRMSGQMVVTQTVGLALLSVIALVLLTTIAVSVLQIRDAKAAPRTRLGAPRSSTHGRSAPGPRRTGARIPPPTRTGRR